MPTYIHPVRFIQSRVEHYAYREARSGRAQGELYVLVDR